MKLSFEDQESFKGAAGSLCFNNPPSDPNILPLAMGALGALGSTSGSSSMPPRGQPEERSEDI